MMSGEEINNIHSSKNPNYTVFLNGQILGVHNNPRQFVKMFRMLRFLNFLTLVLKKFLDAVGASNSLCQSMLMIRREILILLRMGEEFVDR
jgi:uncharacterized membrane protein